VVKDAGELEARGLRWKEGRSSKLTVCSISFLVLLPDETRIWMRSSSIHVVGISNLDGARLSVEGDELLGVRILSKLGSTSFGGEDLVRVGYRGGSVVWGSREID